VVLCRHLCENGFIARLEAAADAFGDRTIAVVLTGSGLDATDSVQTVKARGDYHWRPFAPALVAIIPGDSVDERRM
jgi:hypothetical protein